MLAALTHPRTSGNAVIRQNVLRPLPALLHKCGSTMRSSLDQVVPHLSERLVDVDAGVRSLASRALFELLTVVRASLVVPALLSRGVLGKSVRVREAVLTLLAHALKTREPPPGEELPAAVAREIATLLKCLDEPTSAQGAASLLLLQQLYALSPAAVRSGLVSGAKEAGVPRGAARHVLARIDEFERGVAPELPPLQVPTDPHAAIASCVRFGRTSSQPRN